MFSVTPEIYSALSLASRWLFVFFALMLLLFAAAWLRAERKERRDRFKNLPGAGTVGELLVISGGDELRADTWFPVPREGVLGSLRSCDLVVPCDGVRSHHLDFAWMDRTGLLIRPRAGCEVLIDGVPVNHRSAAEAPPMIHGSVLQVGSAVLRLQLFAALDHTNRVIAPAASRDPAEAAAWAAPPSSAFAPPSPPGPAQPAETWPMQTESFQMPAETFRTPMTPDPSSGSVPQAVPENEDRPVLPPSARPLPENAAPASRRKRADRWKEDWSE